VKWQFTLTKAPWYGGIWERLVQSAKRCLKRVIGRTTLTFLELQTVLVEIEVILNSRPLCPLYDDDMEEPLTPNHLLFGRKLSQYNVQHENEVNMSVGSKRVRYIETVVEHFWERWRKEYIATLRNLQHKFKKRNSLVPVKDDIVLVFEEKAPRHTWCLGRITEIIPSRDGQVRGAKVFIGKTRQIIERPINKLYPIEFATEEQSICDNQTKPQIIEIVNDEEAAIIMQNNDNTVRRKRQAAILADIKRKHMQ
jgi:hypothetical protein